jgi:hypothetical protein
MAGRGDRLAGHPHRLEKAARHAVRLLGRGLVPVVLAAVVRGQVVLPHLAEVVHVRGGDQRVGARCVEAHLVAHLPRQTRHLRRVAAEVGPGALDQADEHVQELEKFGARADARLVRPGRRLGKLLLAQHSLATATLRLGAHVRQRDRVVAHDVAVVDVEHRLQLRVRLPVEQGEGVDVAAVCLRHERAHGRGTREDGLHLARARRDLRLSERFDVVGIRGHDRQRVRLGVEDDRANADLLGESLRDHLDQRAADVGLGQLLRRDEIHLVLRREGLEEVRLRHQPESENRLLDAVAGACHVRMHGLGLLRLE